MLTILGVGGGDARVRAAAHRAVGVDVGAEYAAKDRVATRHKVTFVMPLPKRYVEDVRADPGRDRRSRTATGSARACPSHEDEFFANIAVDPETFFEVYDEIDVPPEQKAAWIADRKGALVGAQLARQFGWKVGDKVTLERHDLSRATGSSTIDGIYTAKRKSIDQSTFFSTGTT